MSAGIKAPTKVLTSKDTNVSKFNHNLSLLIFQLSKIYPDDYDLKKYSDKFEWGKRFNARMICDAFIDIVQDYIDEIMTKNEHFFLEKLDYNGKVDNQEYLTLIQKIITIWSESPNQKLKENIWRYFQALPTYGIMASKRHDLADKLNKYRSQPLTF